MNAHTSSHTPHNIPYIIHATCSIYTHTHYTYSIQPYTPNHTHATHCTYEYHALHMHLFLFLSYPIHLPHTQFGYFPTGQGRGGQPRGWGLAPDMVPSSGAGGRRHALGEHECASPRASPRGVCPGTGRCVRGTWETCGERLCAQQFGVACPRPHNPPWSVYFCVSSPDTQLAGKCVGDVRV